MSLRPQVPPAVPEETCRVARAAFPKGTLCPRIADALGPVYQDQQFAVLFPRRGRPAEAPGRLALAMVLQFVENLSDREAADAVRGRIDWKGVVQKVPFEVTPEIDRALMVKGSLVLVLP
jgi:transposase